MFKLLKYLKPYTLQLIMLIALVFGTVVATLQLPDYMATIIDKGIVNSNTSVIFHSGLLMLLVAFGGGICTIGIGFLS
jgi:ATP-binding cassette subfamily B protein